MTRRRLSLSLKIKLRLCSSGSSALAAALGRWAAHAFGERLRLVVDRRVAAAARALAGRRASCGRSGQMLRALSGTVASYREGDFSLSLVADRDDELGELMTAHNELAAALRKQRAHLVQRELLLDTVMQNSPVALVLVDAHDRIAYANIASRHLLSEGRSLQGPAIRRSPAQGSAGLARRGGRSRATACFPTEIDGSRGDIPPVAARLHPAGTYLPAVSAQAADA